MSKRSRPPEASPSPPATSDPSRPPETVVTIRNEFTRDNYDVYNMIASPSPPPPKLRMTLSKYPQPPETMAANSNQDTGNSRDVYDIEASPSPPATSGPSQPPKTMAAISNEYMGNNHDVYDMMASPSPPPHKYSMTAKRSMPPPKPSNDEQQNRPLKAQKRDSAGPKKATGLSSVTTSKARQLKAAEMSRLIESGTKASIEAAREAAREAALEQWTQALQVLHEEAMNYNSDKDLPLDEYAPVTSDGDSDSEDYPPFPMDEEEAEDMLERDEKDSQGLLPVSRSGHCTKERAGTNAHNVDDFDPPFPKEKEDDQDLATTNVDYTPDTEYPLHERPSAEDVEEIMKLYSVPITRNSEVAIPQLGDENLWLTAIISHESQPDLEIREYECLIQRTAKTLEHAKFMGADLAQYAPASLSTYLVNLGERPVELLKQVSSSGSGSLWFIESHRLTAYTYESNDSADTTDSDDEGDAREHWVVDLYCRFTDGSKKWLSEMEAQRAYNAAVLTYWAGSSEGVREWLRNHPDYRLLEIKDDQRPHHQSKRVVHWILKVLGHECVPKATKGGKIDPRRMTMTIQYCGYPAAPMWWGLIRADKLKKYDPVMYNEYCARKGLNSG